MGTTTTLFSFIAIVIASLGLLALAAFPTRQCRKEVGVDIFAVAGIAAFLIASVSVGVQAFRAASANPVHSLRDE